MPALVCQQAHGCFTRLTVWRSRHLLNSKCSPMLPSQTCSVASRVVRARCVCVPGSVNLRRPACVVTPGDMMSEETFQQRTAAHRREMPARQLGSPFAKTVRGPTSRRRRRRRGQSSTQSLHVDPFASLRQLQLSTEPSLRAASAMTLPPELLRPHHGQARRKHRTSTAPRRQRRESQSGGAGRRKTTRGPASPLRDASIKQVGSVPLHAWETPPRSQRRRNPRARTGNASMVLPGQGQVAGTPLRLPTISRPATAFPQPSPLASPQRGQKADVASAPGHDVVDSPLVPPSAQQARVEARRASTSSVSVEVEGLHGAPVQPTQLPVSLPLPPSPSTPCAEDALEMAAQRGDIYNILRASTAKAASRRQAKRAQARSSTARRKFKRAPPPPRAPPPAHLLKRSTGLASSGGHGAFGSTTDSLGKDSLWRGSTAGGGAPQWNASLTSADGISSTC